MNAKHHDTEVAPETAEPADAGQATEEAPKAEAEAPAGKAARRAERALRKKVERLEKRVVEATDKEQKRIRQLDRARARRQQLEGELERTVGAAVASTGPGDVEGASTSAEADGTRAASNGQAQLAYCLREHRKVEMQSPIPVVLSNGRSALAAKCPSCGATVYKILGKAGQIVTPEQ